MSERYVGISQEEDELRIYDKVRKDYLNFEDLLDYLNKYDEEVKHLEKVIVVLKANLVMKSDEWIDY